VARTVLAGVLAAAALAAAAAPAATPAVGVLRATVVLKSGCPGPRACADPGKPLAGARISINRLSGIRVALARSGPDGRFSIRLRAGRYRLQPLRAGSASARPLTVTVLAGKAVAVTIAYEGPQKV